MLDLTNAPVAEVEQICADTYLNPNEKPDLKSGDCYNTEKFNNHKLVLG